MSVDSLASGSAHVAQAHSLLDLLLKPNATLAGAYVGATIGVIGSLLAQLTGHWLRENADRRRNRVAVQRRVEYIIGSLVAYVRDIKLNNLTKPIPADWSEDLVTAWRGFDSLTSHLPLLGDEELQNRIWARMDGVRMYGEEALRMERHWEALSAPSGAAANRWRSQYHAELLEHCAKALDVFHKLPGNANKELGEFGYLSRRRVPPPRP